MCIRDTLYLFLVADLVHRSIQLYLLRRLVGFDAWRYVREAYLRPVAVGAVMSVVLLIYMEHPVTGALQKCAVILSTFLLTAALVWTFGLQAAERQKSLQKWNRR